MLLASIVGAGSNAALEQLRAKLFSRADTDQDGSVSWDEFRAVGRTASGSGAAGIAGAAASGAAEAVFGALDADGSGALDGAELSAPAALRSLTGGGFTPDTLAALLSGQETAAVPGNGQGSLVSELLDRYRAVASRTGFLA